MMSQTAAILDFQISLFYLRLTGKKRLAVEIHEIGGIHCEVVSI